MKLLCWPIDLAQELEWQLGGKVISRVAIFLFNSDSSPLGLAFQYVNRKPAVHVFWRRGFGSSTEGRGGICLNFEFQNS